MSSLSEHGGVCKTICTHLSKRKKRPPSTTAPDARESILARRWRGAFIFSFRHVAGGRQPATHPNAITRSITHTHQCCSCRSGEGTGWRSPTKRRAQKPQTDFLSRSLALSLLRSRAHSLAQPFTPHASAYVPCVRSEESRPKLLYTLSLSVSLSLSLLSPCLSPSVFS